jgi:hypothetical protein
MEEKDNAMQIQIPTPQIQIPAPAQTQDEDEYALQQKLQIPAPAQTQDEDEYALQQKPIEERISKMSKTSLQREMVLGIYKIWNSMELLSLIGAALLLVWGGSKFKALAGYGDVIELILIGICSILFARIGLNIPGSKFKQIIEKYTNLKR